MCIPEKAPCLSVPGPYLGFFRLFSLLIIGAGWPLAATANGIDPPYTYVFFEDVSAFVEVDGSVNSDGSYSVSSAPGSSLFSLRVAEPVVEHAETELAELILEGSYDIGGFVFDLLFTLEGHAHGTLERSGGQQHIDWYTVADNLRVTGTVNCTLGLPCGLFSLPDNDPVAIDTLENANFTDLELTSTFDSTGGMSWVLPFIPVNLGQHTLTISGTEQSPWFPLPEPGSGGLVALAAIAIGALRRRR